MDDAMWKLIDRLVKTCDSPAGRQQALQCLVQTKRMLEERTDITETQLSWRARGGAMPWAGPEQRRRMVLQLAQMDQLMQGLDVIMRTNWPDFSDE